MTIEVKFNVNKTKPSTRDLLDSEILFYTDSEKFLFKVKSLNQSECDFQSFMDFDESLYFLDGNETVLEEVFTSAFNSDSNQFLYEFRADEITFISKFKEDEFAQKHFVEFVLNDFYDGFPLESIEIIDYDKAEKEFLNKKDSPYFKTKDGIYFYYLR